MEENSQEQELKEKFTCVAGRALASDAAAFFKALLQKTCALLR